MTEFPKMLYHSDGRDRVVHSAEDESAASNDGFGSDVGPFYASRRNPAAVHEVQKSNHDDLAEHVARRVVELLKAETAAPAEEADQPPAPRRGRPPKSSYETSSNEEGTV
jgi:hypothetical protein